MTRKIKCYGPFEVISYQMIMGGCAFINGWFLLAATMGFPTSEAGGLQMLYIYSALIVIPLYRFVPLLGVLYGILPLLNPLLGRWIALPFFFRGISVSPFATQWLFAATAIVGYVWNRVDLHDTARQKREFVEDCAGGR